MTLPNTRFGIHPEEEVAHLSIMQNPAATFLQKAAATIGVGLGWFSFPLESWLRWDFGEEFFTPMRFVAGFFNMLFLIVFFEVLDGLVFGWLPFLPEGASCMVCVENVGPSMAFMFSVAVLAVFHLWLIFTRRLKQDEVHSYSIGISHVEGFFVGEDAPYTWIIEKLGAPHLKLGNWMVYLLIEPVISFAVAMLVLSYVDVGFGIYLILMSFPLMIRNHIAWEQQRHHILGLKNAAMEAVFYTKAATGAPASQTGGFMVVPGYEDATVTGEAPQGPKSIRERGKIHIGNVFALIGFVWGGLAVWLFTTSFVLTPEGAISLEQLWHALRYAPPSEFLKSGAGIILGLGAVIGAFKAYSLFTEHFPKNEHD